MAKEIKDYLHLYLGCQISFFNDVTEKWAEYRKMTASDLKLALIGEVKYNLPLRKLDSMTEAESMELLSLTGKGRVVEIGSVVIKTQWHETAYLLSHGFDLFGILEEQ